MRVRRPPHIETVGALEYVFVAVCGCEAKNYLLPLLDLVFSNHHFRSCGATEVHYWRNPADHFFDSGRDKSRLSLNQGELFVKFQKRFYTAGDPARWCVEGTRSKRKPDCQE